MALAVGAAVGQNRYVNPLSIENSRSIADPAALKFRGKYYLFLTGGGLWSSDDLVHWRQAKLTLPGNRRAVAPHAFEYNGSVYLTGNDVGLFKAPDPLGPWEYIGDFKDEKGSTIKLFDSMVFVDDDKRLYLYYSGMRTDGIWGVELNGRDPTQFASPAKKLWTFDKSHVWERYGDSNEGTELSWLEAPWMTKHNGVYYLQYSAPGTEWKTYAVGLYRAKRPLGPFTYAPESPILVHKNGLINGTGHHTVIDGPDGKLWAIYTVLYRNWGVFDRRVGMDRVTFDKQGKMTIHGPTETPQTLTSSSQSGVSIPVSINRYTWSVSSQRPGRDGMYAFDNNVRTWWEPEDNDREPSLVLDLGCRNPADANQEFVVNSVRLLFETAPRAGARDLKVEGHSRWYPDSLRAEVAPYKYRIETSLDNKTFQTAVDKTENDVANNVEFDEFKPVRCRYVKLTITGKPQGGPMAVLEFTVFGRSAGETSR
jgi:beta-xylosidase